LTAVVESQGRSLADSLHAKFFSVSAIDGTGIRDLFMAIAKDVSAGERFQMTRLKEKGPESGDDGCC
jgi:hypothetical protein